MADDLYRLTGPVVGELETGSQGPHSSGISGVTVRAHAPLALDLGGREIIIHVSPSDQPIVRQRLKDLARRERRRAAEAGNAANTAQQIGMGIGGALAAGGIIALATAAAPLMLGAAVATGVGALIATTGLTVAHRMNSRKFEHDERVERFEDAAEELK